MSNDNTSNEKAPTEKKFSTSYFRAIHNAVNPYTQVRNETVRDASLSFGALGLLTYIFSHSDSWKIFPRTLWKERKEGLTRIYTLFNELIEAGYATRLVYREKKTNGKFGQQMFGYAFFEVKASQEDINNVQEEFKKFYRDSISCNDGSCEDANRYIEKQQKKRKPILKETTTTAPSTTSSSSLPLFDKRRKYLQGVSDEIIEMVKSLYEKQKDTIKKPEAWITQCIKEKWYYQAPKEDPALRKKANLVKAKEFVEKYPSYSRLAGDTISFDTGRVSYAADLRTECNEFERVLVSWAYKVREIEGAKAPIFQA